MSLEVFHSLYGNMGQSEGDPDWRVCMCVCVFVCGMVYLSFCNPDSCLSLFLGLCLQRCTSVLAYHVIFIRARCAETGTAHSKESIFGSQNYAGQINEELLEVSVTVVYSLGNETVELWLVNSQHISPKPR